MIDCGEKPPRQKRELYSATYRTTELMDWFRENGRPIPFLEDQEVIALTIENAMADVIESSGTEIKQLKEKCEQAKARADKLEKALNTIMLRWSDTKLCAKVAMDAKKVKTKHEKKKKNQNTKAENDSSKVED